MAKIKKTITAGPLTKEVIYSASYGRESPKTRSGRKQLSTEAQARMNAKYSWQKLELLLAANFVRGDLVVVLTYDDQHLPTSRKEAAEKLKYFRSKLAAARKARKKDLVMFWGFEHLHGHEDPLQAGRWHHHCVINATGADYEEITRLWGQGLVYIDPLRVDKEKNYESLARYMCKEARDKPGLRSWSYTRNVNRPEVETVRVDEDVQIHVPKGSIIIEEVNSRTEYGYFKYVKYLRQGMPRKKATRRRR